jgi:hypothetical protein
MPDPEQEPMQETPGGLTIPVPSREDVEDALRKLASPMRQSGLPDEPELEEPPAED